MSSMSIGKVARICGLAPSAIRYYEAQMRQLRRMKALLESSFHCHCLSIEDCARFIGGDSR